ncbi:Transcription factor [Coemansia furcata]|nr:Transcription factor [Coemansia furcata]
MEAHRRKPLDLAREPNPNSPKTNSSSSSSSSRPTPTGHGGSPAASRHSTPSSRGSDQAGQLTPSVKLPPAAAISGPVDPARMPAVWGAESLRSGPLSPAMLGGPTATSGTPKPLPTPGSRLGLTDPALHSGLTPYIAGEAPPTKAFGPIRMPLALVTPSLHAAMQATVNGQDITSTPGGTLHVVPPRSQQQQQPTESKLFAPSAPPSPQPLPRPYGPESTWSPRLQHPPPPQAKRSRMSSEDTSAVILTKRKTKRKPNDLMSRESTASKHDDSDLDDDIDPYATHGADGQPLTEEEKRKQFLERNRIAALKCRQRKKKQLQELQDRHDYMVQENERLRKDYMELREVALQARAMLAAHSDCSVARANGVYGVDSLPPGMPVSLHSLVPVNPAEAEYAKKIIDATPPTSNGVPIHQSRVPVRRSAPRSRHPQMNHETYYEQSPRMWRD